MAKPNRTLKNNRFFRCVFRKNRTENRDFRTGLATKLIATRLAEPQFQPNRCKPTCINEPSRTQSAVKNVVWVSTVWRHSITISTNLDLKRGCVGKNTTYATLLPTGKFWRTKASCCEMPHPQQDRSRLLTEQIASAEREVLQR